MTDAGRRTGTSQVYTWEPSNQAIAARYGVRARVGRALRHQHLADRRRAGSPRCCAGPFDPTLNEYPDSEYASLTAAAATYVGADPSEILVGAGRGRGPRHRRQDLPAARMARRSCPSRPTACTAC